VTPDWLRPVADALETIQGSDLTAFLPPDDVEPREGAVLILFGEGESGPDLLLTERSHTRARSASRAARSTPGRRLGRRRCARPRRRPASTRPASR
jgi:hypothetical protein